MYHIVRVYGISPNHAHESTFEEAFQPDGISIPVIFPLVFDRRELRRLRHFLHLKVVLLGGRQHLGFKAGALYS